MANTVIWDFDHSFVDDNSDTIVFRHDAKAVELLKELRSSGMQWTRLMKHMLAHTRLSESELRASLNSIPVFPEHVDVCRAIK
jgi:hypothetical protein